MRESCVAARCKASCFSPKTCINGGIWARKIRSVSALLSQSTSGDKQSANRPPGELQPPTRLLHILGRIHSAQNAREAFRSARDAVFVNLGVDLIFGVPGQAIRELQGDLEKVIELQPEHIAAYNLTIEPDTPYCRRINQGALTLPSEEEQVAMYGLVTKWLGAAGYEHYEISNFSFTGKRSRHNEKYWMLSSYLGIGAGAHSYRTGSKGHALRWWNMVDPFSYSSSIEKGECGIEGEESLDEPTTLREALFLGLRRIEGITRADYKVRFGMDRNDSYSALFHDLAEAGLLEVTHDTLKLTSKGVLLADEVFQNFF